MREIYYVYECLNCNKYNVKMFSFTKLVAPYKEIQERKDNYVKRCIYCNNTINFKEILTSEDKVSTMNKVDKKNGLKKLFN